MGLGGAEKDGLAGQHAVAVLDALLHELLDDQGVGALVDDLLFQLVPSKLISSISLPSSSSFFWSSSEMVRLLILPSESGSGSSSPGNCTGRAARC